MKNIRRRHFLKSDITKKGITRAPHRALYYSMGHLPGDLRKPVIGIVNSQNECMPGHFHLDLIAKAVREGIIEAGGMPVEFPPSVFVTELPRDMAACTIHWPAES